MSLPERVPEGYVDYLRSAGWRATRNRALKQALWTCSRCSARRKLEVHHKTYERLGHEWDSDLEVLCRDCHEAEHVRQMHDDPNNRRYLAVVREVLRCRQFDSVADLADEVRTQCSRLKLHYEGPEIDRAIGLLVGETTFTRIPQTETERAVARAEGRPFSRDEARALLKRLTDGSGVPIRSMPGPKGENPGAIDIYGPVPRENWGDQDEY